MTSASGIASLELLEELNLGSARGGRKRAAPIVVRKVRSLGVDDVELLENPPPVGAVPSIPEIRHQHHQLAGLMARGVPNAEISLITGFSPAYISTLRNAPDMKELISYYAEQADARTVDALARLNQMGITAVEELQQRLNSEPEKFSSGQLLDCIESGLLKPAAVAAASRQPRSAGSGIDININFKEAPAGGGPIIEGAVVDAPSD